MNLFAVAFGLPVIISSFFVQSMLTTILISLALNLLFAFIGGLLAVRYVPRFGAWRMSLWVMWWKVTDSALSSPVGLTTQ